MNDFIDIDGFKKNLREKKNPDRHLLHARAFFGLPGSMLVCVADNRKPAGPGPLLRR